MSQKSRILQFMLDNDGITVMDAFQHCACTSLSSRLNELQPTLASMGYVLQDDWETTPGGARVIRHRLTRVAIG